MAVWGVLYIRLRRRARERQRKRAAAGGWRDDSQLLAQPGGANAAVRWTHVVSLLARAVQEPLRQLRKIPAVPVEALDQLERAAWQARMLVTRPRPMQAKPASPIALLQEAAEDCPLLREGKVSASWSESTRQPVQVDPERARAAFRELLHAAAQSCGEGGKLGIRIMQSAEPGFDIPA